jgi:hypothetical protein
LEDALFLLPVMPARQPHPLRNGFRFAREPVHQHKKSDFGAKESYSALSLRENAMTSIIVLNPVALKIASLQLHTARCQKIRGRIEISA